MEEKILELKKLNPTWGYRKIAKEAKCSHNLVKYHIKPGEKEKVRIRTSKRRKKHPLSTKAYEFLNKIIISRKKNFIFTCKDKSCKNFNKKDLYKKIEENPVCYLTGRKIDIYNTRSYNFDHKIPVSKGGNNSLENLGLACRDANLAKSDKTPEQFMELCKEVLEYNGYKVEKIINRQEDRSVESSNCKLDNPHG